MRILKLKGKSEEKILKEIEKEYGNQAVILSTQQEEQSGLTKWFKMPKTIITIAVKDEDELEQDKKAIEEIPRGNLVAESNEKLKEESYEVLLGLKDQLNQLQREIGTIKQVQLEDKKDSDNDILEADNKWLNYLKAKLVQLGLKEEICTQYLEGMSDESPEEMIRKIYSELEKSLREKEEKDLAQIIFFIGSTGVGKTTTLAKLTAKYVLEEHKKVVLFTADTYRIAAVEQLKTYADILGVEIEVIYNEAELPQYIEKWKHMDYILIDTAGRSHKNEEQVKELKALMKNVEKKQVFLVLNASTAAKDVVTIVNTYEKAESEFDLIITKLDETDEIGNVVNIGYYAKKPIMYLTNGQNVPADIKIFNKDEYITDLLGRISNE